MHRRNVGHPAGARVTANAAPGICLLNQVSPMSVKKRRQLRRQAFTKQACKCFYCQLPMWMHGQEQEHFASEHGLPAGLAKHLQCTAEHVVAQCDRGRDTKDNIVAACRWCNQLRHQGRSRSAPDSASYKKWVEKVVAQGKWHPVAVSSRARARQTLKIKARPVGLL